MYLRRASALVQLLAHTSPVRIRRQAEIRFQVEAEAQGPDLQWRFFLIEKIAGKRPIDRNQRIVGRQCGDVIGVVLHLLDHERGTHASRALCSALSSLSERKAKPVALSTRSRLMNGVRIARLDVLYPNSSTV